MRLYIIRHAEAGQHGDPQWPDDSQRPVTKDGRKRFEKLARLLIEAGLAPSVIATSPYVRCRQTAEALADLMGGTPKLTERIELQPNSDIDTMIRWSNEQDADEIAWIGHAPDVEQMTAMLIGANSSGIHFSKGACALIDFEKRILRANGELRWLLTPKLLPRD